MSSILPQIVTDITVCGRMLTKRISLEGALCTVLSVRPFLHFALLDALPRSIQRTPPVAIKVFVLPAAASLVMAIWVAVIKLQGNNVVLADLERSKPV